MNIDKILLLFDGLVHSRNTTKYAFDLTVVNR